MAVMNINFYSTSLRLQTGLTVVAPFDLPENEYPNKPETYKSIYLLHGYSANHFEWIYNSTLPRLAAKYDSIFILPNGGKSFYLNSAITGENYEDFICKELIEFCNRMLPLKAKREDITIGGLSMGGFGAMHSGLANPNTYGNIIALSSAFITDNVAKMKPGDVDLISNYENYRVIFGELDQLIGSHNDPKTLAAKLAKSDTIMPNIYLACGVDDFLIEENRDFHRHLEEINIKHTYVEDAGVHDFVFWQKYLLKSLEWLDHLNKDR